MKPHEANQAFWDASTKWWKEREDQRGRWMKAHEDPALVLSPAEMPFLKDVAAQDVCVLGSGDNEVAFALTGLGGRVTSVDISERRLAVAAERARTLGLQLKFVQADVTDLSALEDNSFDLVYTGGHMSVWISDIQKYYAEGVRILKPHRLFVVKEYHPMRRMWLDSDGPEPHNRYCNRGPYAYTTEEGWPTFEYHWTVADHIQAVVDAGCRIVRVEEHDEKLEDEYWMGSQARQTSHVSADRREKRLAICFAVKIEIRAWAGSVPPAVAGGYVVDILRALPQKSKTFLDRVSTTCGSGWVRRRHARFTNVL